MNKLQKSVQIAAEHGSFLRVQCGGIAEFEFMKTLTKILLIVSVLSMAVGILFFTGVLKLRTGLDALYVTLPAGASIFGWFLITRVMEKESELFEEDRQAAGLGHGHGKSGQKR